MDRNTVKQEMKEMLKEFTSLIGVSGGEQDPVRAMAARLNLLNAILTFGSLLLHGTVANYALKKD